MTYTPTVNFSGNDVFTYVVSDGILTDTATVTMTVTPVNDAPVAVDDTATVDEDNAVSINLTGNDSDVDSGTLTVDSVTQPANGTTALSGTTGVTYTPTVNFNGDDIFTYVVSDGILTDTATVTVTVTPVTDAPIAVDDTATVDEDSMVSINLTGNDSDVDGDTLTVDSFTQPANGTVVINGTTGVTYTPTVNFNGDDVFTYVASDGILTDTATVTMTVSAVNDAPVAADDSATTPEDTVVQIDLTGNDIDVDGDALSVDNIVQPANGTAIISGTTGATYTPDADFNGEDVFTYIVSDGVLTDTATVTMTVTAANDAPVATDDAGITPEDTPIQIDLVDNDTDIDGDVLSVDSITQPANGTAVISGTTGVTYMPDAEFNGDDLFTYVVSDGILTDTATVSVTVTTVNDGPLAIDDSVATPENSAVKIDLTNNDFDIDGDILFVDSVTQPANGTTVISGTTGVTYTPTVGFSGEDIFTYVVSDGVLTDTATVTVTVSELPEAIIESLTVDDMTPMSGQVVTYSMVLSNSSGVDATGVTVSNTLPAGMQLVNNSVTIDPAQGATVAMSDDDLPALATNLTITASSRATLTFQALIAFDVMTDTVLTNRASVTSTHQMVPATAEVSVTIDDLSTETLAFAGTGVYEANAGNVTVDVVTPACLTGLEVVRNDSDHINATLTLGTGRYWAVTTVPASCGAGFTVNLTLPHPDVPDEDDRLCRYTGSEWDCGEASDHTFDVVAGTVTRFNVKPIL